MNPWHVHGSLGINPKWFYGALTENTLDWERRSELDKWELASDTVKSQQTLKPIAVLDDVTDRDVKVGLVLKFS